MLEKVQKALGAIVVGINDHAKGDIVLPLASPHPSLVLQPRVTLEFLPRLRSCGQHGVGAPVIHLVENL